ncbi:hypothetical protein M5C72_00570 [Companilactobacillus allii]|uniref:Uncharacterized protein n=1 Tax=Companilactobacillus allii TaxID=1847728 RepID=A0A1P8Q1G9_9LACO|nr:MULTISPECIES: hypothetical protein [Companilactobacillus]APX71676.1 hypothetical protein BTM29_03495 [Companilactobacillus allii]USQ68761.1 hypothetical protein M5C72_00570 [Companilactobacillus allii]
MAVEVGKTSLLDKNMKDVFDWSDSDMPVRDAIWDHFMEATNHSTDKTTEEAKKYDDMAEADLKPAVEKLLKK